MNFRVRSDRITRTANEALVESLDKRISKSLVSKYLRQAKSHELAIIHSNGGAKLVEPHAKLRAMSLQLRGETVRPNAKLRAMSLFISTDPEGRDR